MDENSILHEINDFRNIVKNADHGALLSSKQYKEILSWSKDAKTLNKIKYLKSNGKVVESICKDEPLYVADSFGNPSVLEDKSKISFPRWTCHLLGIRHRCSHAVILTPNDLVIIQKRSREKDVSPGALDIAIGGHAKGNSSFEETLFSEMNEELGISKDDTEMITDVCIYECHTKDPNKNFFSIEVRKIFEVILNKGSIDKIKFTDNEVAGVYLCNERELKPFLTEENIASGLKYSIPQYLSWRKSVGRLRS